MRDKTASKLLSPCRNTSFKLINKTGNYTERFPSSPLSYKNKSKKHRSKKHTKHNKPRRRLQRGNAHNKRNKENQTKKFDKIVENSVITNLSDTVLTKY